MDKEGNILVIPRHLVFVKFIDIPSLEDEEIEKMAEFQALKEIPHPKEELVISFRNLGSYRDGFSSLMLTATTKDMIQQKIEERETLNLLTQSIRLHTELLYLYLLKRGLVSQDKVSFVVHIGREDSEILAVNRTRLIFSRGFINSERFLEEIDRSILAFERDKDNPPIDDVIVIYASGMDMKDVGPHIKARFSVPVNFCEYSEDLVDSDFMVQIELLPKEIISKKTKLEKRKESIVTYSLAGFVIILCVASLSFKLYEKNKLLDMLSTRVGGVESKIQGLEVYRKKIDAVKNHIGQGAFIIEVLENSYKIVPVDILISGLDYNGKESIFYKGTSKDMAGVLSFVKRLESSNYFNKVEVKYATKKKIKGEEVTDFSIQCELKL